MKVHTYMNNYILISLSAIKLGIRQEIHIEA